MRIPELLFPLVSKGIVREEQILTYWKDTMLFILPAGARLTLTYKPREGFVYMGRPRDYITGNILTTDDYGFWHRHGQMRWHWDPAVESIYEYEYPYFLEITRDDPLEMEFYNDTAVTVIQDISVFLLECSRENWPIVKQYLKGIFNMFYKAGAEE